MNFINQFQLVLGSTLTLDNLFYCFIGCFLGNIIGLIPGIGPLTTISLLLPFVYSMHGTSAILMLSGIYYGAQYGDAVSAITMKIAHSGSVVLCIDGYKMHQQGRTGLALFTAGFSNFIGGTIAIILITLATPLLSNVAFLFGPAEYVWLMLLGLLTVSSISKNQLNGIGMACIGLLLGCVGTDLNTGTIRFTLNTILLSDGVPIICITLGCFGIAETLKNLNSNIEYKISSITLIPTWNEFKRIVISASRGGIVGSILGLLPGGGPTIAQYVAYSIDNKISKYNTEMGEGSIEGVATPAAADEAAARTSFIPLLSFGIPENPVTALMLSAFIIVGIQPGPQLIAHNSHLFLNLIVSMWIGNIFLFLLNVPMIKLWINIFKIPCKILYICTLLLCLLGSYSINCNLYDVLLTAIFGVFGLTIISLGLDASPLILGFVLGPMLEENFRRQMIIGYGNLGSFFQSNISIVLAALMLIMLISTKLRKQIASNS